MASPVNYDGDQRDFCFKMVSGLADPTKVSFESVNYPGCYLSAVIEAVLTPAKQDRGVPAQYMEDDIPWSDGAPNYTVPALRLEPHDGTGFFRDGATFEFAPPAIGATSPLKLGSPAHSDRAWFSVQHADHPGRLLRATQNGKLVFDTLEHAKQAAQEFTFTLRYPFGPTQFRSVNQPDKALRHRLVVSHTGRSHKVLDGRELGNYHTMLDESAPGNEDFLFNAVPGLVLGSGVSFESLNYPEHYLSVDEEGRLHVALFRGDESREAGTFIVTNAPRGTPHLTDKRSYVCVSPLGRPNQMLRHRDGELWMQEFEPNAGPPLRGREYDEHADAHDFCWMLEG